MDTLENLALIGHAVSEMLEYYGNIHVYCYGVGADELGCNFFRIIIIKSSCRYFHVFPL